MEELREDVMDLPINEFKKVGDFGCGWGFTTWCLMREIPNSECIGIDKFDPKDPPPPCSKDFSLEYVQNWYKEADTNNYPDFLQRNIVGDNNLPSDFDLIYCKRLLYNIFNKDSSAEQLAQAINHIAQALKSNGWFCLVEIQESSFKDVLEESLAQMNFEFSPPRLLYRPYETCLVKYDKYPYLIYQCKKIKY